MNRNLARAITNVCVVALIGGALFLTHDAWCLLGLIFLSRGVTTVCPHCHTPIDDDVDEDDESV